MRFLQLLWWVFVLAFLVTVPYLAFALGQESLDPWRWAPWARALGFIAQLFWALILYNEIRD